MGKGDKRTKRGKIAVGSFGKTRPKHKSKNTAVKVKATTTPKTTSKSSTAKKKEKA